MSSMGQPHPKDLPAEQARLKALELGNQRKDIDRRIRDHADILKREGVTLNSALVDSEGFPLASVDISSIREARASIIALENDRRDIDKQLNELLHVALARPASASSQTPAASPTEPEMRDSPDKDSDFARQQSRAGASAIKGLGGVLHGLGFLDRFLTLWIILAMIIGVLLGVFVHDFHSRFTDQSASFKGVAAPLVVGLIVMMWPILTKVQYERFPELLTQRRMYVHIAVSLGLNWIIGPFVMLALAWATMPEHHLDSYRAGLILVGVARCIAMVNMWTSLARGDCDMCAILVILNSILQMVLFSPYALLLINRISASRAGGTLHLDYSDVAIAVALYLGVPLAAGLVTRFLGFLLVGKERFTKSVLPVLGPLSLLALLYVIIVIFALQARHVLDNLGPTFRCLVPLVLYFIILWAGTFAMGRWLSARNARRNVASYREKGASEERQEEPLPTWSYETTVTQSFTAGSNNFELAIAIAVSAYGADSDQALAATIGPLVEIPVLLVLTYASLDLGRRLRWSRIEDAEMQK